MIRILTTIVIIQLSLGLYAQVNGRTDIYFESTNESFHQSGFWTKVNGRVENPVLPMRENKIELIAGSNDQIVIKNDGTMLIWSERGSVFLSKDGGKIWRNYGVPPQATNPYLKDVFTTDGTLFIGSVIVNSTTFRKSVYVSKDGVNWQEKLPSDIMKMSIYSPLASPVLRFGILGAREDNFVKLANGRFGDFAKDDDFTLVLKLDGGKKHRLTYCQDGSVLVDTLSNVFYYDTFQKAYHRNTADQNRNGEWTYIDEIYKLDNGLYYTHAGGRNLVSKDGLAYVQMKTNFFQAEYGGLEDFKLLPICGKMFATGRKKGDNQNKFYFFSNNTWISIDSYNGTMSYNPSDGHFYQMTTAYGAGDKIGLYRSTEKFECNCNSGNQVVSKPDDDYNIVFYAFGPNDFVPKSKEEPDSLELTTAGHLYVGFAKKGIIQKVKGFSPYTHGWPISPNGKVNAETDQSYLLGYHTHCFTIKVSKEQYDKALAITKEYYVAGANDCVSYGDDVANLLALKTPKLSNMVLLPQGYLNFLKDNNREIGIMNELCLIKPKKSLQTINNPQPKLQGTFGIVKTVQGSNLNLRSQPFDKATIISKIPNGTKIKILDEDSQDTVINGKLGKWLKVEYGGVIGWAWGDFIVKQ